MLDATQHDAGFLLSPVVILVVNQALPCLTDLLAASPVAQLTVIRSAKKEISSFTFSFRSTPQATEVVLVPASSPSTHLSFKWGSITGI